MESRAGGDRLTTVALTVITTPEMDAYAKALVQGVQSSLGTVTTYGNGTGIAFSLKIETMTKAEMESQMAAAPTTLPCTLWRPPAKARDLSVQPALHQLYEAAKR